MKKYEDRFGNQWNKKNLRKWIDACRKADKFPQATGALARKIHKGEGTTVGYCCLGVASKISRCGKFADHPMGSGSYLFEDTSKHSDHPGGLGLLSGSVRKWLGVFGSDPNLDLGEGWRSPIQEDANLDYMTSVHCSVMNDNWNLTLPQIADVLEYFVYNNLPDAE